MKKPATNATKKTNSNDASNVFKQGNRIGYFQKENPGKTIYIGNMSYEMDEAKIFNLFKTFGTVKYVKLIVDLTSGKSKGIAFVQMPKEKEALEAIQGLDGQVVGGRTLKVSEAIEQEKKPILKTRNSKNKSKK